VDRTQLAAVGSPPAAVGSPLAAVDSPLAAVDSPLAAVGSPLAAVGSPLAAVGSPPAAVGSPFAAAGIHHCSRVGVGSCWRHPLPSGGCVLVVSTAGFASNPSHFTVSLHLMTSAAGA
jgi:hypothetical protein